MAAKRKSQNSKPADVEHPNRMTAGSRLTDEQWEQVWVYVRNGGSSRKTASWIFENFGVLISHTAVQQRPEWRDIQGQIESEQIDNARAAIAMNRGEVVEVVTMTIQDLRREQGALRKQLLNTPVDDQRPILNRLNEVEDRLKDFVAAFNKQDQITAARSYRDDKALEMNSKEVRAAINAVLGDLEVKLGASTLADEILDA